MACLLVNWQNRMGSLLSGWLGRSISGIFCTVLIRVLLHRRWWLLSEPIRGGWLLKIPRSRLCLESGCLRLVFSMGRSCLKLASWSRHGILVISLERSRRLLPLLLQVLVHCIFVLRLSMSLLHLLIFLHCLLYLSLLLLLSLLLICLLCILIVLFIIFKLFHQLVVFKDCTKIRLIMTSLRLSIVLCLPSQC